MAMKKIIPGQISLFETPASTEVKVEQKNKKRSAPRRKSTGTKYKSWKGISGLQHAEEIREQLRLELAREPRKRDFIAADHYNAWMALYRHGKKPESTPNLEEIYIKKIRPLILQTTNRKLLEKLLDDIIYNVGPEMTGEILRGINKKRGWKI